MKVAMNWLRRAGALGGAVVLIIGPAFAEVPAATAPVNCATAEGDIRALNSEKDYAKKHALSEVAALTPAGALLGIVTGTEGKKLQMLAPDYEKRIDARIGEIKATCKLK